MAQLSMDIASTLDAWDQSPGLALSLRSEPHVDCGVGMSSPSPALLLPLAQFCCALEGWSGGGIKVATRRRPSRAFGEAR